MLLVCCSIFLTTSYLSDFGIYIWLLSFSFLHDLFASFEFFFKGTSPIATRLYRTHTSILRNILYIFKMMVKNYGFSRSFDSTLSMLTYWSLKTIESQYCAMMDLKVYPSCNYLKLSFLWWSMINLDLFWMEKEGLTTLDYMDLQKHYGHEANIFMCIFTMDSFTFHGEGKIVPSTSYLPQPLPFWVYLHI